METDNNPLPPQNGDSTEPQQPRRRTRFQEAPDEAKSNLPPPGRCVHQILLQIMSFCGT